MKSHVLYIIILSIIFLSCTREADKRSDTVFLTLGAYTVPKEVYQNEIIPAFQKYWKAKTGQQVKFNESYIASGAQSRAITMGFDADIAALSLERDVNRLKDVGLISHNWKDRRYDGFITRSIVVIAVRENNPKNIKGWHDLTRSDVEVLYPSPKTSGGAMWVVNSIYGAGLKLSEIENGVADKEYAKQLLKSIQKRVLVMDKSGRASVTTYESGIGDAILTYENEVLLRRKQGKNMSYIIPEATILIENPIALIDKNVDKHNNRVAVEAFIEFVQSKDVQRSFAEYGFRPVDREIATEFSGIFPQPEYLFDIDYLGGWDAIEENIFGLKGVWPTIFEEIINEQK